MDATPDQIRREIEAKKVAIADKLEALESKVETATDVASNVFSLEHHMRTRPWTSVAIAVGVGYIVGRSGSGLVSELVKKAIVPSLATAAISALRE